MNPHVEALPEGAVLLHIGPHKTGTTAIQGMLANARTDLREHGVLYPGRRGAQHNAVRALRKHAAGWTHDYADLPEEEVWEKLVQRVANNSGRVVISSEFFAQCDAEDRARVVAELAPGRLHLLIAARNPGSIALSNWQQVLRDGKAGRLEKWLELRFRRPAPTTATEGFWSWADAATLVDAWSGLLPADRIHVVVIDEDDKTLLPATFEQLLDLPPRFLSSRTPRSNNRGLTAPEAELVRRVVGLTAKDLSWADFSTLIRTGAVTRLLRERRPGADEPRAGLPEWAVQQAATEAEATIVRLQASGVPVIGDLENLRRVPPASPPGHIRQIDASIGAQAVAGVVDAAVRGMQRAERRGLKAGRLEAQALALDEVPTRELAAALGSRVTSGMTRRLRPGRRKRD